MSDAPPPPEQPAPPQAPAAPEGGGTNGLAIASLILGILSMVCLGLLAGIPAVICGHMALGRIKQSGQGGRGLAIVGLVLGYISIVATIIFILLGGLAFITGSAEMEPMHMEITPPEMPMPE
ncbi:MAG: DUF4190 domain-containing protein [Phycisphaerae bacterium]